jgi:hypothetical protein
MGSQQDIMNDFALQELRHIYSTYDGWKISPQKQGNGYDTHRVWETLYLGSFPIMLATEWSSTLSHLNLPILFVESILDIDKELLEEFSRKNENFSPEHASALWIPFWREKINKSL